MIEHYTEGVVLSRRHIGEIDGIVTLYTKDFGKITAFTKSIRKITSKLSGHLMPGRKVRLRIVENNRVQAVDALSDKSTCKPSELLIFLNFLNEVVPHGEPDKNFWLLINKIIEKCQFEPSTYRYILGVLGFGFEENTCGNCNIREIAHFSLPDIMFLCANCSNTSHLRLDEIIQIKS